jgi:hypothetical protein
MKDRFIQKNKGHPFMVSITVWKGKCRKMISSEQNPFWLPTVEIKPP